MSHKFLTVAWAILFSLQALHSQEKSPCKFGKINPEDLQKKVYSIDSSASAVVISDVGSTDFEGNSKGWFRLVFKKYTRIHILNKNGYEAATVHVPLYSNDGLEEELANVKAVTYNLENGKVVESKLDKNGIFKDKIDKNLFVKKFTLPDLKEGCIIEYQYEIRSDFIRNLQPWSFQGESPVLWSEYNASIPQFFSYVFLSQGYHAFDIRDEKSRSTTFTVGDERGASASERETFISGITDHRWVMKNVPGLKEEKYTSTLKNHISKLEFQLSEYKEPLVYRNVMGSWKDLAKELMESEYFGKTLDKDNNWLGDFEKPLIAGISEDRLKAEKIYAYVRDNFTCTDHNSLWLDQTLRSVVKSHHGNNAEINLLLTAMFKYANITADPVILSTKAHGYTYALYPLLSRFNYVITRAMINDQPLFLDASVSGLDFGNLMPYCYNGHARVLNEEVIPVYFNADSLREKKVSSVFLVNDEKGGIKGTLQQTLGYYESLDAKEELKAKGKDDFVKTIKKEYGEDYKISNLVIDSANKTNSKVNLKYDIEMETKGDDIIYFNPMMSEGTRQNPFKSAERIYPVEMPFTTDEFYVINMEVPNGYVVDELPKSVRVKLNEQGDGYFEYMIQQQDDRISLRTNILLKRAYFLPDEYDMLREFFNLVVKKQNEQIVFKKKK